MTEHHVSALAESEFRAAYDLLLTALHRPLATDEQWARSVGKYEHGRAFGAFFEEELAGVAVSLTGSLAVPGGGVVPAAAVTGVGVRADRTRRGALTSLMNAQLADVLDRGEPIAMLHASEAVIYGRFGYAPASRVRKVALNPRTAVLRSDAPRGGRVRMVDAATAEKVLPEIYQRIGLSRPGMISRTDAWWQQYAGALVRERQVTVAVHSDADGVDDGFAVYEAKVGDFRFGDGACTLNVSDIQAADTTAAVELWRFLLNVDLVTEVVAIDRPVDEPLEWWLHDRRACRVGAVEDDLWLRLVDVRAALNARTFGDAEPVVLAVRDTSLPENSGTYRVAKPEVERCDQPPQLSLDVAELGALYLGDVSVSTLAAANRVSVHDPAAVDAADRLFATAEVPWCGTGF